MHIVKYHIHKVHAFMSYNMRLGTLEDDIDIITFPEAEGIIFLCAGPQVKFFRHGIHIGRVDNPDLPGVYRNLNSGDFHYLLV